MKATLTLCVVAGEEAARISRCLLSVSDLADEIIVVVDDKSKDGTTQIASNHGAKVYVEKWKGFIAQKNSALEKATCPWVLSLDADEALSPQLRAKISLILESATSTAAAYAFPRCTYYFGRWIRYGDWYPDTQLRLWKRGYARWGGVDPHAKLLVDGRTAKLSGDILHFSMIGFDHQIQKTIEYADEFVRQCQLKGRSISFLDLSFRPPYRFVRSYLFRLGFLDRWQGFSIAWMTAFYTFLRYAKVKEAQEQSRMSERATDRGPSL